MISTKVPIKVQKRSGFDKSHHNALSQKVGVITPVMFDELIPNTKVYLRFAMAGSMPPLATDAYLKCYYDVRAFFVPMRLLYGGFESFFSDYEYPVVTAFGGANVIANQKAMMPVIDLDVDGGLDITGILGAGTLSDYLGYKYSDVIAASWDDDVIISAMPFLAYHRVCNDFFRQPNITKEFFARPSEYVDPNISRQYAAAMLPYTSYKYGSHSLLVTSDKDDLCVQLADGVSLFDLRKCNYDYDYFTNALPSAQHGSPMQVASASSFTIPALRIANSLQQFGELNGLAGPNEVDVVRARYGANLSRGVAQRAIYLGGARIDIANKSVDVVTPNSGASANPFIAQAGASAGKVVCRGTDVIIDNFTAEEPGYILVTGCVVPKVTYGSGIRRHFRRYVDQGSLTDMANPLLQNVGNQEIFDFELTSSLGYTANQFHIFGYTDRYGDFMTYEDESHSLFQYNESLQSFVAQRVFLPGDDPVIGSNFLEIPETAIDNVAAVSGAISNFGWYGQFAFEYKVAMPLAQYSLPSLQNPAYEHGKSISIHRGGFRF